MRTCLLCLLAVVAATAEAVRVPIPNGDMATGGDKPSGWEQAWTGKGSLQVARDTAVFHSAPASLRVQTLQPGSQGNGGCAIEVGPDVEVELTGWIRTAGKVRASVMAQPFGQDWGKGPLGLHQLAYRHDDGPHDWTEWSARFRTPPGTARVLLNLLVEGDGSAWLDDVRNAGDPPSAGRAPQQQALRIGDFELAAPPEGDPVATALPSGKPWVPGWCRWDWRAAWVGHHQGFVANSKRDAGKVDVVFYGDSITQGWGDGVKRLDPQLNIVNYGIGGDSTRQILYRASRGELAGIAPRLVVLAIGTNNLYDDANGGSDEEIARGIGACVGLIKACSPRSNVLVCSILPRQNDWFCGRIRRINALVRQLDNGRDIRFLDTFDAFFDAAGANRVKAELFRKDKGDSDWLHIGPKGYERWAELIAPLFRELTR